jgi:preprotein translocase subunit SecG
VFIFFLVVLIIDGVLMGCIILLQSGKGGGLAAMGGGAGGTMADQLIGGRQAATLLTKATWITGGIFLSLSLVLSVMSSRESGPSSLLQDEFRQQVQPGAPLSNTLPLPGTEPTTTGTTPPPAGTTTSNQ